MKLFLDMYHHHYLHPVPINILNLLHINNYHFHIHFVENVFPNDPYITLNDLEKNLILTDNPYYYHLYNHILLDVKKRYFIGMNQHCYN